MDGRSLESGISALCFEEYFVFGGGNGPSIKLRGRAKVLTLFIARLPAALPCHENAIVSWVCIAHAADPSTAGAAGAVPDQGGVHQRIQLHATSISGLPVRFYVDYGPAQIDGDNLILTQISTYAILPIEVKLVAYQWGRLAQSGTADRPSSAVQSAESMTQSFFVKPVGKTRR
jgi:hypothetical protein